VSAARIDGRDPRTGRAITVEIEGGRIAGIGPGTADAGIWLAPGLVDLQINGFQGLDLNRPGLVAAEVVELDAVLAATGVTSFAPTLVTASEAQITTSLRAIAEARDADAAVRHAVPFVHVEGPHVSPEDGPRGAHALAFVRAPDLAELERWQAACGGIVGLVTLSPHWPDATAYIRGLRARGIIAAIGHTHATPDEIGAAVAAGASLSTHLGNGAHAILPRHPNYIWAQLACDGLTASFIADGHHLPLDTLKAMLRAKGTLRSFLVSDAVALAGMPAGIYETTVGGRVELTEDGRLGVLGTPYLAGAARSLKDGVAGAARIDGVGLAGALRMATRNPGRIMAGRTPGRRGVLRRGAPADLIRFRWQKGDTTLAIDAVLARGHDRG